MNAVQIIFGVLVFAFVGAILYVWGLKRSVEETNDLNRKLVYKCKDKVVKHIKKNDTVTEKDIIKIINGTSVGLFWSRKRLTVTDGKKISKELISYMIENKFIIEQDNKYSLLK